MDLASLVKAYGNPPKNNNQSTSNAQNLNFNFPPQTGFVPPMQYPPQYPPYMYPPPGMDPYSHQGYVQPYAYQPNYTQPRPKKPRQPKPENEGPTTHYCESCEKGFYGEEQYQKHISNHEKCDFEDCNFTAIYSVLKLHKLSVHHPRVSKLMKRLETPEEIQKWREERRKNFPTKENVQRKEEEYQEKVARGEIKPKPSKKGKKRKNNEKFEKNKKLNTGDSSKSENISTSTTSTLDMQVEAKEGETKSDETPDEVPITKGGSEAQVNEHPRKRKQCKFFRMGKCSKGENCPYSHEPKAPRVPPPKPQVPKKPSLLERVFEKDITEDKRTILECLRFIVQNNFFVSKNTS